MSTLDIRRKNALNLFREASKFQSFDEFPVLRPEVDPQLHVSNNSVDQPFHLVCGKDTVIALVSGRIVVQFTQGAVRHFELEPGDFVYVPAGAPHRIRVQVPGLQLRYKAREAGLEAVAWVCEKCALEMRRRTWDTSAQSPQEGYQAACDQFNADAAIRICPHCGHAHAKVVTLPFRWPELAQTLRSTFSAQPVA